MSERGNGCLKSRCVDLVRHRREHLVRLTEGSLGTVICARLGDHRVCGELFAIETAGLGELIGGGNALGTRGVGLHDEDGRDQHCGYGNSHDGNQSSAREDS